MTTEAVGIDEGYRALPCLVMLFYVLVLWTASDSSDACAFEQTNNVSLTMGMPRQRDLY